MKTLDFGKIMEKDCWFEDYDLSCPFCNGTGETEDEEEEEDSSCEQCGGLGLFEIMWNTAFEVGFGYSLDSEEERKFAWDQGFCLIKHGGKYYLLMGMCGQDCTWLIHYTRWYLQSKWLSQEDIQDCLASGGHVFLGDEERKELCNYMKEALTTPEFYALGYTQDVEKLEKIAPGEPQRLFYGSTGVGKTTIEP